MVKWLALQGGIKDAKTHIYLSLNIQKRSWSYIQFNNKIHGRKLIFPLNLRPFPYWHSIWLMFTLTAIYWSLAQQKLSKDRLHMLMHYYLHPHKTSTDYKLQNAGLINTDQQTCMLMWYIGKTWFSASFRQNQRVNHHSEERLSGH